MPRPNSPEDLKTDMTVVTTMGRPATVLQTWRAEDDDIGWIVQVGYSDGSTEWFEWDLVMIISEESEDCQG